LNRILIVIPVLALQACSEPAFYFRSFHSDSPCNSVIDSEIGIGSVYFGAYESRDPERPGFVTELDGELFDEPVQIEVRCGRRNHTESVHYIATVSDAKATGALYAKFTAELEARYGPPQERQTNLRRTQYFLCDAPAPVFIEEWALIDEDDEANEDPEDQPHELYVAVVPDAARCLEPDDD
jgi:hypothetical protein